MPPAPHERLLLTFFADVHYYFSPPSQRPPHHRFEKASYLYLYASQQTHAARIEIANNPGTPHQDAFTGDLSAVSIAYSHKQPNLVVFSVAATRPPGPDAHWQLAHVDPAHVYPLAALDVYFYTDRDAQRFLDIAQSLGPHTYAALDVRDRPAPQAQVQGGSRASSVSMSPVVQKLEQAAVTPQYAGQQQPPPPPPPPPPTAAFASSPPPPPLAYNPAAPAAPEAIAHREKTPPPPELSPAPAPAPYAGQGQQQQQQHHRVDSGLYSAPTPPAPPGRTNSLPFQQFAGPPSAAQSPPMGLHSPPPPPPPPPPPTQQPPHAHAYSATTTSPQPSPAPYSPASPGYSPSATHGQTQTQNFYPHQPGGAPDASAIHATAYRPTETESAAGGHGGAAGTGGQGRGGRFDRGVDRFLKKLDKSWG